MATTSNAVNLADGNCLASGQGVVNQMPSRRAHHPRPCADLPGDLEPMPQQSTGTDKSPGLKPVKNRFVRLSVNLSYETADIFRALIERKGLSISEGIRRAIAVWKFIEDEKAHGNQIAVIEQDESVRKVVLL